MSGRRARWRRIARTATPSGSPSCGAAWRASTFGCRRPCCASSRSTARASKPTAAVAWCRSSPAPRWPARRCRCSRRVDAILCTPPMPRTRSRAPSSVAIQHPAKPASINIGTGVGTSFMQLATLIVEITGSSSTHRRQDRRASRPRPGGRHQPGTRRARLPAVGACCATASNGTWNGYGTTLPEGAPDACAACRSTASRRRAVARRSGAVSGRGRPGGAWTSVSERIKAAQTCQTTLRG